MTATDSKPFCNSALQHLPTKMSDAWLEERTRELLCEIEATLTIAAVRTFDIGIDLDGVVYDFVNALRTYISATTGRAPSTMPDPVQWAFFLDWGYTLQEYLAFFNAGVDAGHIFRVGRPLPGVVEGLNLLLADGHRAHIVTDRGRVGSPGVSEKSTRAFLEAFAVSFTTLTVEHDKTKVRTDKFIDDRPENYEALKKAGVDVFLRGHAYNDHVSTAPGRRVVHFLEFTLAVLRDARRPA